MISQDISLFLAPISKENPSGESIRYTSVYNQIEELRGAINTTAGTNYKHLEQACENVLKHTSKDLNIAAVLTEAWANLYGLLGLSTGLELITALSENFWDTIHPNNSQDMEFRLSVFVWINDKLSDVVMQTAVTKPKIQGVLSYTLANLIDARQLELIAQKSGSRKSEILGQAEKDKRPTLDAIEKSMLSTPLGFYNSLLQEVKLAILAIESLEEHLDEKFKHDAITLKNFDEYLVQLETYAEEALSQKTSKPNMPATPATSSNNNIDDPLNEKDSLIQLPLEKLYELLGKVADRIETIEPKSPAAKLVRKAVEWGNMSTTELLHELARNDISLSEITKILS